MARIGLDIDGVLADFNTGYVQLMREVTGKPINLPEGWLPSRWAYEEDLGLTSKDVDECWRRINASDEFWYNLGPLGQFDLWSLAAVNDLYFITTRTGKLVKAQSEAWIMAHCNVPCPTVLISANKGPVAKGLDLTHFVDDRDKNIWSVKGSLPTCQCYILDYPYNRTDMPIGVQRVTKLEDVICADGHIKTVGC